MRILLLCGWRYQGWNNFHTALNTRKNSFKSLVNFQVYLKVWACSSSSHLISQSSWILPTQSQVWVWCSLFCILSSCLLQPEYSEVSSFPLCAPPCPAASGGNTHSAPVGFFFLISSSTFAFLPLSSPQHGRDFGEKPSFNYEKIFLCSYWNIFFHNKNNYRKVFLKTTMIFKFFSCSFYQINWASPWVAHSRKKWVEMIYINVWNRREESIIHWSDQILLCFLLWFFWKPKCHNSNFSCYTYIFVVALTSQILLLCSEFLLRKASHLGPLEKKQPLVSGLLLFCVLA